MGKNGNGIRIGRATVDQAPGIVRVCIEGWRDTYAGLYPADYIEKTIREFYNVERVTREIG